MQVFEKLELEYSSKDELVFTRLNKLVELMQRHGVLAKSHTNKALNKMTSLDDSKKDEILERLNILTDILSLEGPVSYDSPGEHVERRLVEHALNHFGLKFRSNKFWNTVGNNEMLEIYNMDDIQIFRTLNFFKTSSYSLMDLLVNEWFQLWERPKNTLNEMFMDVKKVKNEMSDAGPCMVRKHVFKEIYNAEDALNFQARSSFIQFGTICPLDGIDSNVMEGFIVSSKIIPVAVGEETKGLSFI